MELHLVLIQDVLAQNPVFELSLIVLYLCNVPPVIYNTLSLRWCIPSFGKKKQTFEMNSKKKILEVPSFTIEKDNAGTQ